MVNIQKKTIRYLMRISSTLTAGALTLGLAWLAGFDFDRGPELSLIITMALIVAAIAFINVNNDD